MALPPAAKDEILFPPKKKKEAAGTRPLEKLWGLQSGIDLGRMAIGALQANLPSFTHSIKVAVRGGPYADIRRVWYLCCAAAFGRYRNRAKPVAADVQYNAVWDISGKAVSLELVYQMGGMLGVGRDASPINARGPLPPGVAHAAAFGRPRPFGSAPALMQRGPEQFTAGAMWPETLTVGTSPAFVRGVPPPNITAAIPCARAPGSPAVPLIRLNQQAAFNTRLISGVMRELPTVDGAAGTIIYPYSGQVDVTRARLGGGFAPAVRVSVNANVVLPDDGRIITSVDKTLPTSQSPRPPIDGQTRCSLLALVAQALQSPCFLPSTPLCTAVNAKEDGGWLYTPGRLDFRDWEDFGPVFSFDGGGFIIGPTEPIPPAAPLPDGYLLPPASNFENV